ncbi:hypothetical protein GOB94_12230 [Granulicella sp. 5B5]|uniref:hypothetical protein n=1 Tax=Granulicella sp. 5B5 TaxID=1617967 RepID=UPI0015F521C5|nr:hypothetical protein [Granulicella sp. 5B5]QMV19363.1 hypothetical protein GOB94_12230 [Granulicella sp. 5B5]
MDSQTEPRAGAPQAPPATRALERARVEQAAYRAERARLERRSMVRGLVLLALLVLVVSMLRAGVHNVFLPGWWRHW